MDTRYENYPTPELRPKRPTEVRLGFDGRDVQGIIGSEWFKSLKPTFDRSNALHPRDLSFKGIAGIINSFREHRIVEMHETGMGSGFEHMPDFAIPELGQITKLGHGESSWVFRLTTFEGKTMALVLTGNADKKAKVIGSKFRSTGNIDSAGGKIATHSYSDVEDYFSLPFRVQVTYPNTVLEENIGLVFQEDGGNITLDNFFKQKQTAGSLAKLAAITTEVMKKDALKKAVVKRSEEAGKERGLRPIKDESFKGEHFLVVSDRADLSPSNITSNDVALLDAHFTSG